MGTFSPIHWIVAAIVVLLVFGPKTLARVGKTAGRTVRTATNFKKSLVEAPAKVVREVTPTGLPGDKKG